MSNARHSMGTLLHVNDNDDGVTFAIVPDSEIIDITGPENLTGEVKATHLSSPNFYKERKPGLLDQGKVTIKLAFTNLSLFPLKAYHDARAVKNWKILYPLVTGETVNAFHKGAAFITKLSQSAPDAESEERIMIDMELSCSGNWTFTKAT